MYTERLLLIYILGGYFISPVAMNLVKNLDSGYWHAPYLIWGLLILTTLWATRSKDIDGI